MNGAAHELMTAKDLEHLKTFAADVKVYSQVATKRNGSAWLCSVRTAMRLEKDEFDRLAIAAHQADLIELCRADLTDAADERYLTESEIVLPTYSFHFVRCE